MEKYVINIDALVDIQLSKFIDILNQDDATIKQIDSNISKSRFLICSLSWSFDKEDTSYKNLLQCFNGYIYQSNESISIFYMNLHKFFPNLCIDEKKLSKITGLTFSESVDSLVNKISELFDNGNGELDNKLLVDMINTLGDNIPSCYESFISEVSDKINRYHEYLARRTTRRLVGIDNDYK